MMMTLVATFALVLAAAGAAYGQPLPVPPGPGGSCPYGWAAVGSYCQPPRGAQGAVPISPGGSCPYGWAAVGSYCQQPQGAQGAVPIAPGGSCPYGWAAVGSYCQRPQGAQDADTQVARRQLSLWLGGGRLVLPAPRQLAAVEARESYAGALERHQRTDCAMSACRR